MSLYLVTGNKNKLKDIKRVLGKISHINLDLDEIQSLDPIKISDHKVKQAYSKIKKPVIVTDQSIFISCLNGFPGPLVKWFYTKVGMEKICQIATLLNDHKISAQWLVSYYDGKVLKHFIGEASGTIPLKPQGRGGYG